MQGGYPIKKDHVEQEYSEDIIYDLTSSINDLKGQLSDIYYGGCFDATDREVEILMEKLLAEEKLLKYYMGVENMI